MGVIWALAITWAFWEPPAGPSGAITVRVVAPAGMASPPQSAAAPASGGVTRSYKPASAGLGLSPGAMGSSVFGNGNGAAASYNAGGSGAATASYAPSAAAAAGAAAASRPDASLEAVIALRLQEQAAARDNSFQPGQPSTLGAFGSSHSINGGGGGRMQHSHQHHHHSLPTVQSSVNFQ
jgi:hypothetical protein